MAKRVKRLRLGLIRLTRREFVLLNALATVVGIIAGYAAIFFRNIIGFFQNAFLHDRIGFDLVSPLDHTRGAWIIIIPALGLLVVAYITKWFAPEAKGHGVPEVIQAVMAQGGRIRKRIVAIKALASALTIATGGSVGREGPIVQIGSAAGSAIGQLLKSRRHILRTLVGCGAAGAVAATFNTPIAGVVFAIEIIVVEFKAKSFIPLVISTVMATILSRLYLGNEPAFVVPQYSFDNPFELVFYLGLGLLAGLIGVFMTRFLYFTEDFVDNLKAPLYAKALGCGLILGVLGYFYPQIFGVGYETVESVIQQQSIFSLMFLLIFLKIFAVSLTLAGGGSGGIFAPSLYVGAMLGGAYGFLVNHFFPEIAPNYGAYAMIGMAAMFSANSRAVFTSIVILFEMTLNYSIILPLMFACVISDQIAWVLSELDIYSLKLKRKGIFFDHNMGVNIHNITPIKEIMTEKVQVFHEGMTLKEANDLFAMYPHSFYPLVDDNEKPLGLVKASELRKAREEFGEDASILTLVSKKPITANMDDPVAFALKKIEHVRDPRLMVIDPETGKLVGILSPKNVMELSLRDSG